MTHRVGEMPRRERALVRRTQARRVMTILCLHLSGKPELIDS